MKLCCYENSRLVVIYDIQKLTTEIFVKYLKIYNTYQLTSLKVFDLKLKQKELHRLRYFKRIEL